MGVGMECLLVLRQATRERGLSPSAPPCSKCPRNPIRNRRSCVRRWCIATTEREHASAGRKPACVEKTNCELRSTNAEVSAEPPTPVAAP